VGYKKTILGYDTKMILDGDFSSPFMQLSFINGIGRCHAFISRSAAFPKATEQPAAACRNQYGRERPLSDELLAGTRGTVDFFLRLPTVFRGFIAHLPEFLLGSVPHDPAHFLQVCPFSAGLQSRLSPVRQADHLW
jgi:hypothetical protein